jgi:hypothetical protein
MALKKHQQIVEKSTSLSLISDELPLPFPEGWNEPTQIAKRNSTGVSFIDSLLRGGTAPGESYGILEPGDCGKTSLAAMISVEAAKAEYANWAAHNKEGVPGRAYHFFSDDSINYLRRVSLVYMTGIKKDRLEEILKGRDISRFSIPGNYETYELPKYKQEIAFGEAPPGEYERFVHAQEVLNCCWRPVDMTGADSEHPGRGYGMVQEVAAIIGRDVFRSGARCLTAIVDHVKSAVRMHLARFGKERHEMRTLIDDWPLNMKRQVGLRFNCPVWSVQQFSAESNAAKPGDFSPVTLSSECRSFACRCDVCFALGVPTRGGQVSFDVIGRRPLA